MKKQAIHIKEFCDKYSQYAAAEVMGCTQGNISQIVTEGKREIFFEERDGGFDWYEIKKRTKRQKSAA